MNECERGCLSRDLPEDDKNIIREEKIQQRPGDKPETRPHFPSLEAWHEYNKHTRGAKQSQTIKSLEIYKSHTAKATDAIKGISEGLRASMELGYIPNQLDLKDGAYNPKYIDWLEMYLTNSALALSEILTYDELEENKGFIKVWKDKAQELITNVQHSVVSFKEETYSISYALEYYNYYRGFVEELGLKDDFEKYITNLYGSKS